MRTYRIGIRLDSAGAKLRHYKVDEPYHHSKDLYAIGNITA